MTYYGTPPGSFNGTTSTVTGAIPWITGAQIQLPSLTASEVDLYFAFAPTGSAIGSDRAVQFPGAGSGLFSSAADSSGR